MPVKELIPKEGATGWLDTWMLSAKAKHPNCAYAWLRVHLDARRCRRSRRSTFGETPVNKLACAYMNKLQQGLVRRSTTRTRRESYYASIKFWKTPVADCGNGKKDCMDYSKWVTGLERGDLVATNVAGGGSSLRRARRRLSAPFWRHRWLRTVAELRAAARRGCRCIYVAALAALFVYAFWSVDSFTGKVVHAWTPRQLPRDLRERRRSAA